MITKIAKPFKTFEQQIDILENKEGLIVSNRNRLQNYLKEFNFQRVIDGYNDPFLENNDRRTNKETLQKYSKNITSDLILDFFDCNIKSSNILIKEILRLENRLNTSVSYEVLRLTSAISPSLLQIEDNELFKLLFTNNITYNLDSAPNINSKNVFDKVIKDICYKQIVTQKSLDDLKMQRKSEEINMKDKNFAEDDKENQKANIYYIDKSSALKMNFLNKLDQSKLISSNNKNFIFAKDFIKLPFYVLVLFWDFGTTLRFFSVLNKDIQKNIIKENFKDFQSLFTGNEINDNSVIVTFYLMMKMIKDLRNKISHNNVTYNINYFESIRDIWDKMKSKNNINENIIINSFTNILDQITKNKQINLEKISVNNSISFKLLHITCLIEKLNYTYDETISENSINFYNSSLIFEVSNLFNLFYGKLLNIKIINYIKECLGESKVTE